LHHGPKIVVTVRITNTGSRAGAEVTQLYVGFPGSAGGPPRQLKDFQKVTLQPGQHSEVRLTLDQRDLSYWNTTQRRWVTAPGTYQLMVGTSSRDIRAAGSIALP